jgi:hypothetical protein
MLDVQILMDCDTQTLLGLLEVLTQQANVPALDTETMLIMLEIIAIYPQPLQSLRKTLHG